MLITLCEWDDGPWYSLQVGFGVQLVGYTDVDWAGHKADKRSTSGFIFSISNGSISLSSKMQSIVTLSCKEVEYKGTIFTACEVVWLKRILKNLGVPITDPIRLYCDNISSIHLVLNPIFHARTKHIEVHYQFF